MSFKVKGHNMLNPIFVPALRKLATADLPFRTAWNLRRMLKQFDKLIIEVQEGQAKFINKYGEKEKEGLLVPQKDEEGKIIPNSFIIPEDKQTDLNAEGMKLMQKEWTIESEKLTSEELEKACISATDLDILEFVLDID